MELTLMSRSKRVKEKVMRDHYWYDQVQKRMLHDIGGEMRFRYDPSQKRSVPYIVDHEEWVYRNDYPEIQDWVKDNKDKYDLSVENNTPGRHIVLQAPAAQFAAMQADLYKHNIVSDWNERELKQEIRR